MGARNVGYILANGAGLSDTAFRVGVFIGLHARDIGNATQRANEYTLGARACGEILWPDIGYNAARQRYTRAINELVDAKLVTRGGRRGGGGTAQTVHIGRVDNGDT